MGKQTDIIRETVSAYKRITKSKKYTNLYIDIKYLPDFINSLEKENGKYKVTDIVPLKSGIINFVTSIDSRQRRFIRNKNGLFHIKLASGDSLVLAQYFMGNRIQSVVVAEERVMRAITKLVMVAERKANKPKTGIFMGESVETPFGRRMHYEKVDHIFSAKVIHHEYNRILNDMNFFFNNVNLFTRYNMPGVRKVLLVGEPGTGKTSILYKIADKYGKKMNTCFVNQGEALAAHASSIADYNVPSIIFLEDADTILERTGSFALNFLDGIKQPTCNKGLYVIMTTNFPERIEDRIKKRPGRIDKIFNINMLEGKYAVECAKLYFDGIYDISSCNGEFNKLTGAQIKCLSTAVASYAVGEQKDISPKLIAHVRKELMTDMKMLADYAEQESLEKHTTIGFGPAKENALTF